MFGPAPQHGGTQQVGTNFWFPAKKPKPVRIYPLSAALHQDRRRNSNLLNVCKIRRGRSCSFDVYLLSQRDPAQLEMGSRMLNFFIGLMLSTPFGFVLGAMMSHAKYADERMALERFSRYQVCRDE